MQITITQDSPLTIPCDALFIPLFKDDAAASIVLEEMDMALHGQISKIIQQIADCTDFGQITSLYTLGNIAASIILLAGAGKRQEITVDKIRSISAIAMRKAQQMHCHAVAPLFPQEGINDIPVDVVLRAVVEGTVLATYQFDCYKTICPKRDPINTIYLMGLNESQAITSRQAAQEAIVFATAVNKARDLVNHPSLYMTPTRMAQYAAEIATLHGLAIQVMDRDQMLEQGMHALLAVAQGSTEPPRMIILTYTGNPDSSEITAFVGKGITFDSGGISLKPGEGMGDMKDDMAGGAAVLAAMAAIGQLRPKTNIIGLVPCTENMPSGCALKPGDIIATQKGTTIEIISTDAEGRLILADAVSHAKKLGATRIVDLATLTGACVTALGTTTSGVLTNHDGWWSTVLAASQATGEKLWRLPSYEEYQDQIKSDIADLKNSGGRAAGAITAGLFIGHFAGDTPWVHIDIAGTATCDKIAGYNGKGASGVGVRTLIELAQRLAREQ